MPIEIHPSAESNFNDKALEIVALVQEVPESYFKSPSRGFSSELVPRLEIGPERIRGPIRVADTDESGRLTAAYFTKGQKIYGIQGQAYECLRTLAAQVGGAGNIASLLSLEYVTEALIEWIESCKSDTPQEACFIAFLRERAAKDVEQLTVFIPLANLEVQEEFAFGGCHVTPLSRKAISEWAQGISASQGVDFQTAQNGLAEILQDCQGLAAVRCEMKAEQKLATAIGVRYAKEVVGALSLFSPAIWVSDVRCISGPIGGDSLRHFKALIRRSDGDLRWREGLDDAPMLPFWRISSGMLSELMNSGLKHLSDLYGKDSHSKFERAFLNFVEIYSRSSFTADPLDKVVYTVSALETLFLRDNSEAIQQNLGERIAILIGSTLDDRKEKLSTVRRIYGLRSRFLHHGKKTEDRELVTKFLLDARVVFGAVLANIQRFQNKEDFLAAIDDEKLRPKG